MDTKTYLLILLAVIVALAIAAFQYFYKYSRRSKVLVLLAFLRFLSLFLVFLVLINPTIEKQQLELDKPKLVVAVDNSSSIKLLSSSVDIQNAIRSISGDNNLARKFDIELFGFDEDVHRLDSLNFSVNKTNISKALIGLDNLFEASDAMVLITDGNQTLGSDYSFYKPDYVVYPVAVGDTIAQEDLKITKVNVNRYSFLNNTFPVELFVNYNGDKNVSSNLRVSDGTKTVFRKTLTFNETKNSERITFNLKADEVGVLNYRVFLNTLPDEVHTINNRTNFTVEVIDEQSKIALVADMPHPDLGMFKRAIETNKQRKVTIIDPKEISTIKDYQLCILYQPNNNFKKVFELLKENTGNYLVISGTQTDWNFLNGAQEDFNKSAINQTEEYQATRNTGYSSFTLDDFDFEGLPPLTATFGTLNFNVASETILFQNINNIQTEKPLLATFSKNDRRGAILLGENIWKWRAYSYSNDQSFLGFDRFMNKLVQYLSIKKRLNRLDLDYTPLVYQNDMVTIRATYFDTNYTVDTRANLTITLRNEGTGEIKKFPFRLSGQSYFSTIPGLESGDYVFTVSVEGQEVQRSGKFTVLDYNIEQQFTHANITSLKNLAATSNGRSYHISNLNGLIEELANSDFYKPIQRSSIKRIALIDWKLLLGFTALFLSLEWFIRKYYGKI